MVGKVKHMLERDGRYYSRLVVPLAERPFLGGKIELRTPLGADYKAAVKSHFVAIADMMLVIGQAEAKAVMQGAKIAQPAKYRLTINQIAQINYQQRLTQDTEGRLTQHYAQIGIDDLFVKSLRSTVHHYGKRGCFCPRRANTANIRTRGPWPCGSKAVGGDQA